MNSDTLPAMIQESDKALPLDIEEHRKALLDLFREVGAHPKLTDTGLNRMIERHVPMPKDRIIEAYRLLAAQGAIRFEQELFERLRIHPIRTMSGVTPDSSCSASESC